MCAGLYKEELMPTTRRNILYIRCSDGRSRRPESIREHCVHQIRAPGGILNPLYRAQNTTTDVSEEALAVLFLEDIETMVKLKNPDEIIVASHHDCGAAAALGYTHEEILQRHRVFGFELRERFQHITVTVMHETHSECGEYDHVHQMVAQMS